MAKIKVRYEVFMYIAYSFFMLFGIVWFVVSTFRQGGHFNPYAFFIVVAFGSQFYYKHRLTNLILGILSLFLSIWMLLDVINSSDLMARGAKMDNLDRAFLSFCLIGMIMSGILIFSYTKLSFRDRP